MKNSANGPSVTLVRYIASGSVLLHPLDLFVTLKHQFIWYKVPARVGQDQIALLQSSTTST